MLPENVLELKHVLADQPQTESESNDVNGEGDKIVKSPAESNDVGSLPGFPAMTHIQKFSRVTNIVRNCCSQCIIKNFERKAKLASVVLFRAST
jgi:hypothetical protein